MIGFTVGDPRSPAPPEEQVNRKVFQFALNKLGLTGRNTVGLQASDDGFKDKPQASNVFAVIEELPMGIQVKRFKHALRQFFGKIDSVIYFHVPLRSNRDLLRAEARFRSLQPGDDVGKPSFK